MAALVDAGFGLDKQIDSVSVTYSDPIFNSDITMSGTKTNTNNFSIGGGFEVSYSPFILGIGINYNAWLENTKEQISSESTILKSNALSVPVNSVSGKVYGGVEIPIGKKYTLGAVGGYDTLKGPYFGLRNSIRLNPSKE